MHLFLAAMYTNGYRAGGEDSGRYAKLTPEEKIVVNRIQNNLESYHYVSKQKFVDAMRTDGVKVFLDSGAFSAYFLGVEIDIDAYCQYIIENEDILRIEDGVVMASVLDGIGDPLKTWQNQVYMESKGAKPLPCFHFGEDERYLEHYVANYEYITLGGLVGRAQEDQKKWLDRMWEKHMLDPSGRARLKVHAFGMTSPTLMERYPWYSVDSSSWIQAAAFGSIFTAKHGPISVSSQSPSRHEAGRHLSTLTQIERAAVEAELNSAGFNYERLSEVYESRAAYNCHGYYELEQIINRNIDERKGRFLCQSVQELF